MKKIDWAEESLKMHQKLKGKIFVGSKIKLKRTADLSLAYTPGVGFVSSQVAKDKNLVWQYTARSNMVAVVSDGSAVLGLGNVGPEAALPVMEGKALLFKELAGIDAFPICLATQNEEEIITIVANIAPSFGGINLEDISAPRCFYIEQRLQNIGIPVFHDDQWGSAIVISAALKNALFLVGKKLRSIKIVILGAGAAGIATTKILLEMGAKDIILVDRHGAIYGGRADLNWAKEEIAKKTNKERVKGNLAKVIHQADVFIGVSGPGLLKGSMIKSMAKDPIVFALANPIPEIMPNEAKKAGVAIVATGRSDLPNQVNNLLAFPGVFRGALDARAEQITMEAKIAASQKLASLVEPQIEKVLPNPLNRDVAKKIAETVYEVLKKSSAFTSK